MTATVKSGMGEGAYYISLPPYREQVNEKLGFYPFPGTLNIKLQDDGPDIRKKLNELPGIGLEGFMKEGRSFGEDLCYPCTIGGLEGAVIVPERGHYRDVLEVISPWHLRKELELREGSRVSVLVCHG